ncbi:ExbD/TolR family protein [Poriferisphaera sp. WC338]|uniref:ExbD/TolR family protein n=1 Tax=Poriferisphaera sp. WC338 TaxID=3425129 RepID=UPI003D81B41F
MKSRIHKRGPATPRMNLTPLIDIVFLLVIFFMLVNTMASKQTVKMLVPELEDPQTHQLAELDRIVISVAPVQASDRDRFKPLELEGNVRFVQVGPFQKFEPTELQEIAEAVKSLAEQFPKAPVMLRADAAIYFDEVQPIMNAITAAGISTVNLVAYLPADQGTP